MWADKILSRKQAEVIETAIQEVEKTTSVELVVVVARASAFYSHTKWILFLLLCLFDIPLLLVGRLNIWSVYLPYFLFASCLILQWFVAAWFARLNCVKRWLTMEEDMALAAHRRAECEFFENKLHHTTGKTGVLVFVSALEHRVVVLADEWVSQKLPKEFWGDMVREMIISVKVGKLGDVTAAHFRKLSAQLHSYFPAASENPNELHDKVIFKD